MIRARSAGKALRILLAVGISAAILFVLCWKTGVRLGQIFHDIANVDPYWLLFIFLISATIHIFMGALKWLLILRGIGCDTRYREVLFVRMGSDPIRFAMPFKLGEISNVLYYPCVGKLSLGESASWILFDKALNFLGTLFWLVMGMMLTRAAPPELRWPVVAAGGLLVMFLILPHLREAAVWAAGRMNERLGGLMRRLLVTFERISPRRRASLVGLALLFQLRPLIVCYLLFVALGPSKFASMPDVPEMLAKGSAVVVASNMPLTVGPREAALSVLFRDHLRDPAHAAALISIGILMAIAIHVVPAFIGLPFMASFIAIISAPRRGRETNGERG